MRQLVYFFIIVLVISGAILAYLNPGEITLNYYFGKMIVAKPIFVLIAVGVGLCCGLFFTLMVFLKLKSVNYKLRNRIKLANKELENLRTMPIRDHH